MPGLPVASYEQLFEWSPDPIVVHRDGAVLHVNRSMVALLRAKDAKSLRGLSVMSFLPDDGDRAAVGERFARMRAGALPGPPIEVSALRVDGTRVVVEANGHPVEIDGALAVVTVLRDLTERKRQEARLMKSERLASMATLVSGIARELNDPLSYVIANVEVAVEEVEDELARAPSRHLSELLASLDEAREGAGRARQIVRDLGMISHAGNPTKRACDVKRALEIAIGITKSELRHRAEVVARYDEPLAVVIADDAQLTQVFVALLANAAQAIAPGNFDAHQVRVRARSEGADVVVEIEDTGPGVPANVVARLFDPFFTTKSKEHSGLGLSLSHAIVTGLGGTLAHENLEGAGALFRVTLPAAPEARATDSAAPAAVSDRARGRVLVVDDDPMIGRSMRRVLSARHEVHVVEDGHEALTLLLDDAQWDVVLCDLMMPVMSGWELHDRVAVEAPAVHERFVFVTGGALTPEGRSFLDRVPNARMDKPFDVGRLRALVDARVAARRGS